MVADFRFEPDRRGIEEISTKGPAVDAALTDAAERAADKMKTLAAGMDRDDYFGFRDSLRAIPAAGSGRIAIGSSEGVAYAGSSSPGWHLQEFGTRRARARAILRRALRMTNGIDFKEGVQT